MIGEAALGIMMLGMQQAIEIQAASVRHEELVVEMAGSQDRACKRRYDRVPHGHAEVGSHEGSLKQIGIISVPAGWFACSHANLEENSCQRMWQDGTQDLLALIVVCAHHLHTQQHIFSATRAVSLTSSACINDQHSK